MKTNEEIRNGYLSVRDKQVLRNYMEPIDQIQKLTRKDVISELEPILIRAIGAMKYAGFNYDGTKYDDFDKRILDSTGVSDSLYISIRDIEDIITLLKQ